MKKRLKTLVLAEVNRKVLETLNDYLEFTYMGYADNFVVMSSDELVTVINDYDIVISEFETIDEKVLKYAKKLKLIVCLRAGVDTVVDVNYASSQGIKVTNTPGRNASAVAEYVIGQIIDADRYLIETNNMIQKGILQSRHYIKPKEYKDALWGMDVESPYHVYRGRGLQNLTLGVIGYGRVGRVVVEKAQSLGMKVLVYDQLVNELIPEIQMAEFDNILRDSDIVSLHCSNPNGKIMFSYEEFSKMKPESVFINTARGNLVDEEALIKSVKCGHIRRAVLDVTSEEPLPKDSCKLVGVDGIILTPHIAGATDIVIDNGTRIAIAHIKQFIEEIDNEQ